MKQHILKTLLAGSLVLGLHSVAFADELPEHITTEDVVATVEERVVAPQEFLVYTTENNIEVNGEEIPFVAYTIEGYTYVRLTDLAYSLTGTASRFNVAWENAANGFIFASGQNYHTEDYYYAAQQEEAKTAIKSSVPMFELGAGAVPMGLTSYIIDGESYFQLDQMSQVLDFSLAWDSETDVISLNTKVFG